MDILINKNNGQDWCLSNKNKEQFEALEHMAALHGLFKASPEGMQFWALQYLPFSYARE